MSIMYNPRNIVQHEGREFVTQHARYAVKNGNLDSNREDDRTARGLVEILLLGGITPKIKRAIENEKGFLVPFRHLQKPKEGLCLYVLYASKNDESIMGFMATSPLKETINPKSSSSR